MSAFYRFVVAWCVLVMVFPSHRADAGPRLTMSSGYVSDNCSVLSPGGDKRCFSGARLSLGLAIDVDGSGEADQLTKGLGSEKGGGGSGGSWGGGSCGNCLPSGGGGDVGEAFVVLAAVIVAILVIMLAVYLSLFLIGALIATDKTFSLTTSYDYMTNSVGGEDNKMMMQHYGIDIGFYFPGSIVQLKGGIALSPTQTQFEDAGKTDSMAYSSNVGMVIANKEKTSPLLSIQFENSYLRERQSNFKPGFKPYLPRVSQKGAYTLGLSFAF